VCVCVRVCCLLIKIGVCAKLTLVKLAVFVLYPMNAIIAPSHINVGNRPPYSLRYLKISGVWRSEGLLLPNSCLSL